MQNNSSNRKPYCLSFIAGIALMVVALGFAFFPNIAEAVPDMYVANNNPNSTISRADLNGNGGEDLGDLGPFGTLSFPAGIALDLSNGYMYVVNFTSGTISRADLNGNGGEDLGDLGPFGTLSFPAGIALDLSARKMYVANSWGDTISRADLGGTGGEDLGDLAGTLDHPIGIALDLRQPATVPTLSEWGMIILSLLMAGSAILIIRRRKLVTPNSVR